MKTLFWKLPLLVTADQLSKWVAERHLPAHPEGLTFIPGVMRLLYAENVGAAFSLLPNQRAFFIAAMSALIVVMAILYRQAKPEERAYRLGLVLIMGGGLGNLIDRIFRGFVVDFLDFVFIRFAVFNLADVMISLGVCLFAWHLFGHTGEGKHAPRS